MNRAFVISGGPVPIALVDHLDVPQCRMRRREIRSDGQRLLDCTARLGKHVMGRPHAEDAENGITVGKTRVGECVIRVAPNGLLKEHDRLQQARLGLPRPGELAARVERVRFRILGMESAVR